MSWVRWLPNALTVMRFILGLVLPWSPPEWQFWMLLVAGSSDLVDGWLSRRFGVTSGFGQFFDPIADKTLVLATLFTAISNRWITWPELIGLAARDLTVLVLSLWALSRGVGNWRRLTPRLSGKLATGAQLIALLTLFWRREPMPVLVWSAAAISVVSAVDYSYQAFLHRRAEQQH